MNIEDTNSKNLLDYFEICCRKMPQWTFERKRIRWNVIDGPCDNLPPMPEVLVFSKGRRKLVLYPVYGDAICVERPEYLYPIYSFVKNIDTENEDGISGALLVCSHGESAIENTQWQLDGNRIYRFIYNLDASPEEQNDRLEQIIQRWLTKQVYKEGTRRKIRAKEQDLLREYVASCRWRWASGLYYRKIPHEYIVRNQNALTDDEFSNFVQLQRNCGTEETFAGTVRPYLYLDGYKYWTMGAPIHKTTILNRQKVFTEYDSLADTYETQVQNLPDFAFEQDFLAPLAQQLHGTVLDIGCGTGRLLDWGQILPENYTGIDPSSEMLKVFCTNHPQYANRVERIAFEQYGETNRQKEQRRFDVAVALFGSPSYLMGTYYLNAITRMADRFYLMFYSPVFEPPFYAKTVNPPHHFTYTQADLHRFFDLSKFHDEITFECRGNWTIVSRIPLTD